DRPVAPDLQVTKVEPLGDGDRQPGAETVAAAVTGGDVRNRPTAGVARDTQPEQGDLCSCQAGFALAGIGLEPLDGADRVYPVLCQEPPTVRYETLLRARTAGACGQRRSHSGVSAASKCVGHSISRQCDQLPVLSGPSVLAFSRSEGQLTASAMATLLPRSR